MNVQVERRCDQLLGSRCDAPPRRTDIPRRMRQTRPRGHTESVVNDSDGGVVFATSQDVAWINVGTAPGLEVTSGIPPVFQSYCTVTVGEPADVHSRNSRLVALLEQASVPQPWWMGFLETGAS